jgi:hypothetical protein
MAFVIWSKEKHGSGLLDTLNLDYGRYELEFDTRLVPDFILGEMVKKIGDFAIIGKKKITLEDVTLHYRDEKRDFIQAATFHLNIERASEVGLPVEAGLTPKILLAGLGIIGGVIAIQFLREVRKVVEPKNVIPVALILLIILGIVSAITGVFKR